MPANPREWSVTYKKHLRKVESLFRKKIGVTDAAQQYE